MAPIEQHRRLAVRRGKLEPPRGGLVGRLYLGDHASKRTVAQAILGEREHVAVLAALGIQDAIGAKPDLFEARRI